MTTTQAAVVKAVILHLVIAAVLLISVDFTAAPPTPTIAVQPIVKATVVDKQELDKQLQKVADAKAEIQRKIKQKKAAEKRRIAKRKQAIKEARERALAKKRALKKQQEEQHKAAELAKQEKIRKQQEAEKARELKRKKELQARQDALLEKQLQAETAARNKARQQQIVSEVDKYKALINSIIRGNMIKDDSMYGKSCKINIHLATNGFVTQVNVIGGDTIVCEAAKRAVLKSDTLPVSSDPQVYQQLHDINLIFTPEK